MIAVLPCPGVKSDFNRAHSPEELEEHVTEVNPQLNSVDVLHISRCNLGDQPLPPLLPRQDVGSEPPRGRLGALSAEHGRVGADGAREQRLLPWLALSEGGRRASELRIGFGITISSCFFSSDFCMREGS